MATTRHISIGCMEGYDMLALLLVDAQIKK